MTTLTVHISGMKTKSPNDVRFASRRGMFAESTRKKAIRDRTRIEVQIAMFNARVSARSGLPSSVVITRHSSGELDVGNMWSSCKELIDGLADALQLTDDRELQKRMTVQQARCPRGQASISIELVWGDS